jgi:hypothetical protein
LSCGVHRKRHCPSPENATALSLSSSVSLSPTLSLTGWLGRTALSPSPLFFLLLLLSHGWSGQQGNSPSSFLLLSFFSFPSSSLSPSRLTLSLSLVSHARQGARHSLLPSFTRGQQGLRACCVAALVLSLSRLDPRVNSLSSKIAPHFTPKQLSLSPTLACSFLSLRCRISFSLPHLVSPSHAWLAHAQAVHSSLSFSSSRPCLSLSPTFAACVSLTCSFVFPLLCFLLAGLSLFPTHLTQLHPHFSLFLTPTLLPTLSTLGCCFHVNCSH